MSVNEQPLNSPISAVIFDCDGTLSKIEGIDELAKNNNTTAVVKKLTEEAMSKTGMTIELYNKRLELVQPTYQQVVKLGKEYITQRVPDIDKVMQILQHLKKTIYIVSAGLYPSVNIFGKFLNISSENIHAVDIQFDSSGNYINFDQHSPLVTRNGKQVIVNRIKQEHARTAYIGDGLNDLEVRDLVTRFIGYGGVFFRENIKAACHFYVESPSIANILPFILTQDELKDLYVLDNNNKV
ncbi:MAG: HAD-IB family phosphatase [Gammaproteobacteria bacterium]|nr:HAD-IB family phosphatase [Gammaproteobacteria bacterium]